MSKERHRLDAKTILLIGSTGHGKSTLGNFLLNPDERYQTKSLQPFAVATSNLPKTQVVEIKSDRMDHPTLCVIDTPGLNESTTGDLQHMVDIVMVLKSLKEVSACILYVRFDAKIDAQYKATINYYKSLLPKIFEGNILIVMTNFATDRRSIKVRELHNTDVDAIVQNAAAEVASGLPYALHTFLIDCLPIEMDQGDTNRKQSENTCLAILSYIEKTMQPIRVDDLKVAKTDALKQRDREEIKAIDGEIRGHNIRLQQVNAKAKKVLNEIESMEKQRSKLDRKIANIKEELEDKDSNHLVTAATWSLKKEWKFFKPWQEEKVECVSPWPIATHTKWDNGHLEWKNVRECKEKVTATVCGGFWRGLYATLTIKTHKRHMHVETIRNLQSKKQEAVAAYDVETALLERCRQEEKEYRDEIHLLQKYIEEKNHAKKQLSSNYMSLDEAEEKLRSQVLEGPHKAKL